MRRHCEERKRRSNPERHLLFPSPRVAGGRVGEFHVSEMSRGGGRTEVPPTPNPSPPRAARTWAGGEKISFSRRIAAPSSLRGAKATKQSRAAPETGLLRCARSDARNRVLAAHRSARAMASHGL